jgi:tRNA (cmo5U34)-methyltransferase
MSLQRTAQGVTHIASMIRAPLSQLPEDARILVVGSGTGSEILVLAQRHPNWRFEAVEPAEQMLALSRRRIAAAGIDHRVVFHHRLVEGMKIEPCDAATSSLVAQHIVDDPGARRFFTEIAANLVVGAPSFSADISVPDGDGASEALLRIWQHQATTAGLPRDAPASLVSRFGRDLEARSPARIAPTGVVSISERLARASHPAVSAACSLSLNEPRTP